MLDLAEYAIYSRHGKCRDSVIVRCFSDIVNDVIAVVISTVIIAGHFYRIQSHGKKF